MIHDSPGPLLPSHLSPVHRGAMAAGLAVATASPAMADLVLTPYAKKVSPATPSTSPLPNPSPNHGRRVPSSFSIHIFVLRNYTESTVEEPCTL